MRADAAGRRAHAYLAADRDLAAGTRWARVAERPIEGLPLTRETEGDVAIFRLRAEAHP